HAPRTRQAGHEYPFAAKDDFAHASDRLNIVVHAISKGGKVAATDKELIPFRELSLVEITAAMDQHGAAARYSLQEEPGPTKERRACASCHNRSDVDVAPRRQE